MILTFNNGYPDYIGYRQAFVGNSLGPASYTTGGDTVTLQNSRRFIDILFPAYSLDGNYVLVPVPNMAGERATWKVIWYYTPWSSVGTPNDQVPGATNLSGVTVEMGGFCGQY
jgi:hypothetical protein